MAYDKLNLEIWDRLPTAERACVARSLARDLPAPFSFLGLQTFKLGDHQHEIARFDYQGIHFVLIPGGRVTLGYNPAEPFLPTPAQLSAWEESARMNGIGEDLEAYIAAQSTALRVVDLVPFLMEVRATEAGQIEPLDFDCPIFDDIPSTTEYNLVIHNGDVEYYRVVDKQGFKRAYRLKRLTHRALQSHLTSQGFRLPTSDEWEHGCRAGSRTLFRWGDGCPVDCFPNDRTGWNRHRQRNAFGLHIADNPYHWELVAEPQVARGGDGRGLINSGAGCFAGWLTLTSGYIDSVINYEEDEPVFGAFMRRLFPLD